MVLTKSLSELRAMAREQLRGNWGKAILANVILLISSAVCGIIPVVGVFISIILTGPLTAGLYWFFLKLRRNENPAVTTVFDGFNRFGTAIALVLLQGIFTFLWSLLLIIPGIIAALSYSMAFFIMMDDPAVTAMDAIGRSKEMMQGNKWKFFLLGLSFIGWALLTILTFGVGMLWLGPYMYASYANFYDELKQSYYNGTDSRF
jgi:uncharacterized membrane protein